MHVIAPPRERAWSRWLASCAGSLSQGLSRCLPGVCVLCGNRSCGMICAYCDAACWNEARLRCRCCAIPLAPGARAADYLCEACREQSPPFDASFALADYRAPLDALALALKFHARTALGREFGLRLAHLAGEAFAANPPDLIAPVPLSRGRLISRGYNQAWEIARPLARALRLPASPDLVERVSETAPQSQLALDERRDNVEHAFAVRGPVDQRHIALVDDVMTSGATLGAIAVQLKAAGARRVTCLVALRTAKD